MTPRQKDILDFINDYWQEHGYSPSYEEIAKGVNLKSKSGIGVFLAGLEARGHIVWNRRLARAVTPVSLLNREFLESRRENDNDGNRGQIAEPETVP